jgi:hypothetical protein
MISRMRSEPRAGMCPRVLVLALIACSSGCASAPLCQFPLKCPCLQGPFETDREKITAAIEDMPRVSTKPSREQRSSTKPDVWMFADGVVSEGGGGLPLPYREGDSVGLSARVEYDATNDLARYVGTEVTIRGNQLVDERYYIATVRPTVEQARDIACLANQLLNSTASPTKPAPAPTEEPSIASGEIVVTAHKRELCDNQYNDGHWESLQVRVGGRPAPTSKALSCSDAGRIEALLSGAVGAAFLNAGIPAHAKR